MNALSPLKKQVLSQLTDDHFDVAFVTGHRETAGYELGILMQATAIQISQNKEVISLWLSPSLRTRFRQQSENYALAAQFHTCDIPTHEVNLLGHLLDQSAVVDPAARQRIPQSLKTALELYVQTNDVVRLYNIKQTYANWQFTRLVDRTSGQAYLVVRRESDQLPTLLNLTGSVSNRSIDFHQVDRETVTAFIRSRAMWLEPTSKARSEPDAARTDKSAVSLHGETASPAANAVGGAS